MQSRRTRRREWTLEEDAVLRSMYGQVPWREIAKLLNRAQSSIASRAKRFGLTDASERTYWTPKEDALLRGMYRAFPRGKVAQLLNRTRNSVTGRAKRLGITGSVAGCWTPEETEMLKSLYATTRPDVLEAALRKTATQIGNKAAKLGLKKVERGSDSDRMIARWLSMGNGHRIDSELSRALMKNTTLLDVKRKQLQLMRMVRGIKAGDE